jgi:hypothetical protein
MDDTYTVKIYVTSFLAAIVLLVIGITVYQRLAAVPSESATSGTWGGGTLVNPLGNSAGNPPQSPAPDLYQQVQSGPPFYYSPAPSGSQTTSDNGTYGNSNDNFDLNAFLAELSQPKTTPAVSGTTNANLNNAYAFIPQGLVSTSTSSRPVSPSQQALYDYGNSAGSIVQQFERDNANMAQVLKDQFEDPQDPQKISALDALADGLSNAGDQLGKINPVPAQAASLNAALASAYKDMGGKLALVGKVQTDQDRATAMATYNKSADAFIKSYVATALMFSSSGVTFGADDSGSVFMFTGSGF